MLAAAALILLIRKLNGELRFCTDYRVFNKITVKNWYSILLINKILENLSSDADFTKLNRIFRDFRMMATAWLWQGYNKSMIKYHNRCAIVRGGYIDQKHYNNNGKWNVR